MKSQDIVILLKLVSLEDRHSEGQDARLEPAGHDPFSVRALEASLGISKTEVSASQGRSVQSGLALKINGRVKTNRRNLSEFILHGLKYTFPVSPGTLQRGVPTGFAAPMLEGQLVSGGLDVFVWPWSMGKTRGLAIAPLFESVPEAAKNDEQLYRLLALVDAIRLGNQRETKLAAKLLEQNLLR